MVINHTPIIDILQTLSHHHRVSFHTPGHKQGGGISPFLANLLGKSVFQADFPELPELDNLFAPESVIQQAQELAAHTFGAQRTWFLVNGSTSGVMAAILATCTPGDKIILPRNIHQCAIAGLILSGAIPIFINPEYDPRLDLTYSVTPQALAQTLTEHRDAKAVMMVYPNYHGICGDLAAIAEITHQHNIPLLVDEAHGAHFAFHHQLPQTALQAGADVVVQSTHKVLGAMTQASMLHLQGNRVDSQGLTKALQLLQSSSPSYLLLASLDGAREQMASQGEKLMNQALKLATIAREGIKTIPHLSILELKPHPGFHNLDLTRLTVFTHQLGIDGFRADEILHQNLGVTAELPMSQHLTFIITFGNTAEDIDKLITAFTQLANSASPALCASPASLAPLTPSLPPLSPREAFFAPAKTLPSQQAIGSISAELICPYPPGIPVLMPGELITVSALDYLQQVINLGGIVTGCNDSSLASLQVVDSL